jgi:ATP synthase protein I
MGDYLRLQRRLNLLTAAAIAVAVPGTAWGFGLHAAVSLLLGGLASLLYLRLLGRSVARFGVESSSLGKTQLLIPVLLVLVISRVPQLDVLPALAGFLLYKPALLLQALLEA